MKLEKQVCSLELAEQLEKLGVKQESLFYWSWYGQNTFPPDKKYEVRFGNNDEAECSAFTVAELGEMLPATIDGKYNDKTRWYNSRITSEACVWYDNEREDEKIMFAEKTEADARAKMLISLIENKLL